MNSRTSRARFVAPTVAVALAATSFVALAAAPANAASTTVTQSTPTYLGDFQTRVPSTNSADIHIPATGTGPGAADVYPSTISFSQNATISDVDVDINGLTSTAPTDLDLLLVGPHGQQAVIMSDSGDSNDVSNVSFTIDDESLNPMPDNNGGASGTFTNGADYQPSNGVGGDNFPAPAPALTGNSSLSVFDGTLAAGTWSLYIFDDAVADTHTIASWGLTFTLKTSPYPSTVGVSGLPPVTDVNVVLGNVWTTFSDDIDLLLVGPGGQQATLMSDAGLDSQLNGATIVLDDEAPNALPDGSSLTAGTYRPANYSTVADPYPAPAPIATGATSLAVFDGLSPNGDWRLYAQDDQADDLTAIGSWSLQFSWADTVAPTGTVSVNGGAASTSSTSVTLGLNATDPAPASGVTQMRFSNDGVTYSAFQPYATTAAWTLTTGDGVKTVYAQFRDGDGNISAAASDTITLTLPDTTSPTATKTTPKKNATGVKVTTKVKVKSSEALNAKTVNAKTVFLKMKGSSKKVKAKVSYNAKGKTIVLTPKSKLKSGKKYTLTVTTKVKDVAGNAFDGKPKKAGAQPFKFSFTTA